MHSTSRRALLRYIGAASLALAAQPGVSVGSVLATPLAPGPIPARRLAPPGLDVDKLLDESAFPGLGSRVEAAAPSGDHTRWERVLARSKAEIGNPQRTPSDGSRYWRLTRDPLDLFTGREGFLLFAVELKAGSEIGLLIGNVGRRLEFGPCTVGVAAKDGDVGLLVYEGAVATENIVFRRLVGAVSPGTRVLGFAFAEGGRRVGAFIGTGDIGWAEDYDGEVNPFNPLLPTRIGCWSPESPPAIGTVVAYQPKR